MPNQNTEMAPWGEASFVQDRQWYGRLPASEFHDEKANYRHIRDRALEDPEFDLFDHFMPTGRPKHDIGRYVLGHGVPVPVIRSMPQWQAALRNGHGMLRSELAQDYDGLSGVLQSQVIPLTAEYPRDEDGNEDNNGPHVCVDGEWVPQRSVAGPVNRVPELAAGPLGGPFTDKLGSVALTGAINTLLCEGLYDGTTDPAALMRLLHWQKDWQWLAENAMRQRYPIGHGVDPTFAKVSRWHYIPGVNVRVFRDPVIEGKYYIGGREAHHTWEVTEGRDSPNVEGHTKAGYRYGQNPKTFQYELPTRKLIDLYERVRTLPYFDQRQAPMMELQYGSDGRLHFLQYLKTGLVISDPGEFDLKTTADTVIAHQVRGATQAAGERVRIYMDPAVFTKGMQNQAFFIGHNASHNGPGEQIASMISRVTILDYALSFKDNHFSSAPLYRPPVGIGLWDGIGEAEDKFRELSAQQPRQTARSKNNEVEYIDAVVTSNGRKAAIESDWLLKSEKVN